MKSVFKSYAVLLSVIFVLHANFSDATAIHSGVIFTQTPDSSEIAGLSSKLDEYFSALKGLPANEQEKETDFIINACKDSSVKRFVALKIYDHYMDSPVMGDEAVAIYLTDKWFSTKKIMMNSDVDLMNARIFAEFNRQSLIGCRAPLLKACDAGGDSLEVIPGGPFAEKRYRILYFYDTGCVKCKLETPFLMKLLKEKDYPVDFYAFYSGADSLSWHKFISDHFSMDLSRTEIYNAWDASLSSDFQRKYGVIQTPRLFLIDPDGIIIGRGLDIEALERMLHSIFSPPDYQYGGEKSKAMFDKISAAYGYSPSFSDLMSIAENIREKTLGQGNLLLYKHLEGDYMYWLASQRGEEYKKAEKPFLDKYIFDGSWKTGDDTLKVLGFARILDDLLSRTPAGSKLPDMTVRGIFIGKHLQEGTTVPVLSGDLKEIRQYKLRKLHGSPLYIVFFSEGCRICKAQLASLDSLRHTEGMKKARFLLVNVDQLNLDYPKEAQNLMDTFDLSSLPFIISADRKGIITGKYIYFTNPVSY
ncbi:MAG: redoxin domain-containing protein [Bacteroidales bacterium]|jgi:thiol-disulfide isomerase/thioredoxin|nr:redoxin domain-containing protein [Bacteroidales bacterium]MCI1785499.1 redoxin domain-containing protein [Bacteroidales bacterium]